MSQKVTVKQNFSFVNTSESLWSVWAMAVIILEVLTDVWDVTITIAVFKLGFFEKKLLKKKPASFHCSSTTLKFKMCPLQLNWVLWKAYQLNQE